MFKPDIKTEFNPEEYRKKRTEELRNFIMNEYVKPDEYYKKGESALTESAKMFGDGAYVNGELVGYEPNKKAPFALSNLDKKVREEITAHGVASNIPGDIPTEQWKRFPLFALLQIMATGEVKGGSAQLEGSLNTSVFTTAPFILLSNRNEPLMEDEGKITKLKNLRTVLVNGQYESMIDSFKKIFPGVSFRKAEEINDSVFDKKSEPFKSFEDQISEQVAEEIKSKLSK